ncbi:MAG: magnesium/cobalt transporter CorA [Phycisphaerales bacterium]|nr:magnesium/cobalt transporter CorA [Phycisphaerales bacterium]
MSKNSSKPGKKRHPLGLVRRLSRTLHPGHAEGYPEEGLDQAATSHAPTEDTTRLCIDYGPDGIEQKVIDDLETFFNTPRPKFSKVRWIRVVGTPDSAFMNALGSRYHFHPLALEDLIQIPQRPKVDEYAQDSAHSYLSIIASAPWRHDGILTSQQVSIFVGPSLVVSFQEHEDGLTDRIQDRLNIPNSRVRNSGSDFLMYCLLDNIVDRLFPILVELGDELENLDEQVMDDPDAEQMRAIHQHKREMMMLRREVWPMREMLHTLRSSDHEVITSTTQPYLRDVYDHCIHIVDMMETYRDAISSILDIHMNMMSNRMNEVMKVLTIIATIFIPLSFLSGVFGMNFTNSLPGQEDPWSFTIFSITCGVLGLGMLSLFWWRKWL